MSETIKQSELSNNNAEIMRRVASGESFTSPCMASRSPISHLISGWDPDADVIVARLDRLYEALRSQSLGADESLALILKLLTSTE